MSDALTFERWQSAGQQIARVMSSSAWCIGDWIAYGESRYRDKYREAIDLAGLDYQTVRNYVWVARRFELSRRRGSLSFQHHAEVASLSPAEQDRWLDRAERDGWSRNQLRVHLRASRLNGNGDGASHAAIPRIKANVERVERWREAAAEENVEFRSWVIASLDAAARQVLRDDD